MTTLTVTSKGQITLKKEALRHLGVKPGEQINFETLPEGELRLIRARPFSKITNFIGLLANSTNKILSIEEMNEITAAGWADEK